MPYNLLYNVQSTSSQHIKTDADHETCQTKQVDRTAHKTIEHDKEHGKKNDRPNQEKQEETKQNISDILLTHSTTYKKGGLEDMQQLYVKDVKPLRRCRSRQLTRSTVPYIVIMNWKQ